MAEAMPAQPDLSGTPGGSAAGGTRRRQDGARALEVAGVTRAFGALVALDAVDLAVGPGERHAVLGANGAGKTTLFNVVTGDFPPTRGRISFFGEDITDLPQHDRIRRGLRRTYQHSLLFRGLTVRDNLFLASRGVARRRFSLLRPGRDDSAMAQAERLAAQAHLAPRLDSLVADLSYGEQRQLEIGMALAGAPRLILFDEPAAGLSPGERGNLVDLLHGLPEHLGYVIIEHDLDVALKVVERVTVMHNGRIFKHGTPDEIEADPEVQAIYLGGQHG
ncbi:MAG: ABC transporter ATP-binding protein [Sneathiellaceae bacterium]